VDPRESGPGVRLVYETHATTTDNEAGIATGWTYLVPPGWGRDGA
jgi:hypothetical protein